MHGVNPLILLLMQIALILTLSRAMGLLFARFRQPQVMGEMIAGILLGPSLLGWLAPAVYAALFPSDSTTYLFFLSQFGVIFFLFLIGLDLDPMLIRQQGPTTFAISISSIAVPFLAGAGLTAYLYNTTDVFADPQKKLFLPAMLFMGAAMSITAFPVLARILTERNLHKTRVGALAIACAAVNDLAAWIILAFVVAMVHASQAASALRTAFAAAAYVVVMFFIVRPLLGRLQLLYERQGRLSQGVVATIFLLILASAMATESIGIHAMFGAFMIGFVMPKGTRFVRHLSEKLEDYTVVLLLPIFFAYTGLKTRIGLLDDAQAWAMTLLIVAVACLGKFGGTALAARAAGGMRLREASAVGVLMNTRGLVELVILSIGLEMRVINESVFAMMVIMALITTALTTPVLHWIYPARLFGGARAAGAARRGAQRQREFAALLPVSLAKSGVPLLQLADMLAQPDAASRRYIALNLRRPVAHEAYRSGLDEADDQAGSPHGPLEPMLEYAAEHHIPVEPISFVSRDVAEDIAWTAQNRGIDLILMGFHKPVIGTTILGGTVHRVLTASNADVAIFVDRGFRTARRVLVPFMGSQHDRFALELANRMARNLHSLVTVLHVVPPRHADDGHLALGAKAAVDRVFHDPAQPTPVTFRTVEDVSPVEVVLRESKSFDLVIIGVAEEWGLESHLFGWRPERIARDCPTSLLIVRKHGNLPNGVPAATAAQVREGITESA